MKSALFLLASVFLVSGCAAERSAIAQDTSVAGFSTANATVSGGPYSATGTGFGNSFAVASCRYCVVNVVMVGGHVDRVNYSGPTGGLFTGGEQCAFAVRNCVQS